MFSLLTTSIAPLEYPDSEGGQMRELDQDFSFKKENYFYLVEGWGNHTFQYLGG